MKAVATTPFCRRQRCTWMTGEGRAVVGLGGDCEFPTPRFVSPWVDSMCIVYM